MEKSEAEFSREEILRYSRHILIPEFRIEGQLRLKKSKVLVIGAGGLGSPILLYLAAAGVGQIGIVDGDQIDETNLQRQVIFDTTRLGKLKAEEAASTIRKLNPHVHVETYITWLKAENALDIIRPYDLVIDGTDNFPTRYLVNDACVLLGKPLVYGSIFQFEGQVSVFNHLDQDGNQGPNYRDLFPEPPPPGLVPSCSEGGVLGVLPGIIGSMQANEAIKILTGIGSTLSGRLFIFDALNFQALTLKISRNPDVAPIEELIDYNAFCGINTTEKSSDMPELSPIQFVELKKANREIQLIDVREPYEYAIADIGGEKIPLAEIEKQIKQIRTEGLVVFYCRSGRRSAEAIQRLKNLKAFNNLYNLTGGILAYIEEIDSSLNRY
ncbi:MAG: molybdopterin-synthase adenylyltransferase MoeB [Saprospiraceae bacterium]|nr:molybdopterin-synthase adenylyltransferase MoeB [Saprospiraceae bacterium]